MRVYFNSDAVMMKWQWNDRRNQKLPKLSRNIFWVKTTLCFNWLWLILRTYEFALFRFNLVKKVVSNIPRNIQGFLVSTEMRTLHWKEIPFGIMVDLYVPATCWWSQLPVSWILKWSCSCISSFAGAWCVAGCPPSWGSVGIEGRSSAQARCPARLDQPQVARFRSNARFSWSSEKHKTVG